MGNNSTRQERGGGSGGGGSSGGGPSSPGQGPHRLVPANRYAGFSPSSSSNGTDRLPASMSQSRSGRSSRPDLSFLGIGSQTYETTEPRRETKQEREARKLEKERVARLKERERSMREEHVDGGYLVTQGVYTGPEDFNKAVVRQLMIERRLAPFWRGLEDHENTWTEYQLVAAARGLPIPPPDVIPEELVRPHFQEPHKSSASPQNIQNLTIPINSRSQSTASNGSANLSPSHPVFSLPPPTSPLISPPGNATSPFRPRSKTLASLTTSSRAPASSDMVPREIQLPFDPYVNGQPIEAFLYKDAPECIICMMSYPPYLNRTRCCDQPICSECFVQIKRADPHPPHEEQADSSSSTPPPNPDHDPDTLVTEPAQCPYCQQPEFGVTYEPPQFRRGLTYANMGAGLGLTTPMSFSTSLSSMSSPPLTPHADARRRTTSLSANASTVITTDRIRPDWATKLQNARNHAARRSAAATALHTAAYLMGNGGGGNESRGFAAFGSRGRFGRSSNRGADSPASGADTPGGESASESREGGNLRVPGGGGGGSSNRRSRMEDLEDMMVMEAIRLSLAAEEERKRKEDKENKKLEKKREKDSKKADKAAAKRGGSGVMYSASGNGGGSASGSTLSLSLPSIVGRRRGNSASSSMLRESSTPGDFDIGKGKSVDRGIVVANASASALGFGLGTTTATTATNAAGSGSGGGSSSGGMGNSQTVPIDFARSSATPTPTTSTMSSNTKSGFLQPSAAGIAHASAAQHDVQQQQQQHAGAMLPPPQPSLLPHGTSSASSMSLPIAVVTAPDRPSHLRQMSNASSASPVSSTFGGDYSAAGSSGSYRGEGEGGHGFSEDAPSASANAAGTNRAAAGGGGAPGAGATGGGGGGDGGGEGSESMFNFRSLAAMIGREEGVDEGEKEDAARHVEYLDGGLGNREGGPGVKKVAAENEKMESNANYGVKRDRENDVKKKKKEGDDDDDGFEDARELHHGQGVSATADAAPASREDGDEMLASVATLKALQSEGVGADGGVDPEHHHHLLHQHNQQSDTSTTTTTNSTTTTTTTPELLITPVPQPVGQQGEDLSREDGKQLRGPTATTMAVLE